MASRTDRRRRIVIAGAVGAQAQPRAWLQTRFRGGGGLAVLPLGRVVEGVEDVVGQNHDLAEGAALLHLGQRIAGPR